MYSKDIFIIEDGELIRKIYDQSAELAVEFAESAALRPGQTVVVGCSTSEILGDNPGSHSAPEIGKAVFDGLNSVFGPRGIFIAAQCCEHLNRAIVVSSAAVPNSETVCVVPQPKAGGSFAAACYNSLQDPVVVEEIKADAGIDIGRTLIGMHLKRVAVPLRLKHEYIGQAIVTCARTRPKYIGGERAVYHR